MVKIASENISNETLDFMDYLLTVKKADANLADIRGWTALHQLANMRVDQIQMQIRAIRMLLDNGADPNQETSTGDTAFTLAFTNRSYHLLNMFLDMNIEVDITAFMHLLSTWQFD